MAEEEIQITRLKQYRNYGNVTLFGESKDKVQHNKIQVLYEESLKGLQPHPNLKALRLSFYMGVRIPSWVSSITNLVSFQIYRNRRLQHLPPLNQLPFLKFVSLCEMEALEYISDEDSESLVQSMRMLV